MDNLDRSRRRFAMALAAMAGFVDAVGFLSADGYFVSFMSGNTTRLGVALGTDVPRALVPALLIAGFVGGVTLGALVALRAGARRKPAVLGLVTLALLGAALARVAGLHEAMLAGLGLAMGVLNNTFLRDGEVAVGLTYMTGALVKLGQGLARQLAGMGGQRGGGEWRSWALLWAGLLAGAVLGAFLQDRLPLGCLWIATGWAALMAALGPYPSGGSC
jgi:uncharacterized membrane protein YoaK (UPF0700 family)